MTRLDYFIGLNTVLVFLALVEVLVTSALAMHKRETFARKLDRVSRVLFPALFAGLLVWSFFL